MTYAVHAPALSLPEAAMLPALPTQTKRPDPKAGTLKNAQFACKANSRAHVLPKARASKFAKRVKG